jgi:predicted TIM-barrel fold metal-dependent hydrolase
MALDVTGDYRYPLPDEAWLALRTEDIIDPDLLIIDAHHHLWEQDDHPYLLDELLADIESGHNIVATVCVEARYHYRESGPASGRPVGEAEAYVSMIRSEAGKQVTAKLCAGMVCHADLTLGDGVDHVIEAHIEVAGARLKGIRHSVARDEHFPKGIVLRPAPKGLLADSGYRRGLKRLMAYGLSYEAMLYHSQIPELTAMARSLPGLPIVLDHFGCILGVGFYAGREQETFTSWHKNMRVLSDCLNVSVKLGGMGMIVCGAQFHERPTPPDSRELAQLWQPYYETCLELFGPDRCMFESNFPVDKSMYSYAVLWNAFKRLSSDLTQAERNALFHDTAKNFYDLEL